MKSDTLTQVLALWGALLSTLLFVRGILKDRRDDGHLRVRVHIGTSTGADSIEPICQFEVVNIGRRPVFFRALVLYGRNGEYLEQVLGPGEEGGYIRLEPAEVCDNFDEFYRDVRRIRQTRRICAFDTMNGRTYLPRWRMWGMRVELMRIRAKNRALKRRRARALGPSGSAAV